MEVGRRRARRADHGDRAAGSPWPGRAPGTRPTARRSGRAAAPLRRASSRVQRNASGAGGSRGRARSRGPPTGPARRRGPGEGGRRVHARAPGRRARRSGTRSRNSRGFHQARPPGRGRPGIAARLGVDGRAAAPAAIPPTRQQRGRHVAGEQAHRRQAAGVRQLGQRGGQRDPGREADRGLDGAGHHDRQPAGLRDPQRGPHPAERLDLEHDDVRGPRGPHGQGSSARRIDSSAATGTSTRRRSTASSSSVAHGCSAYSRPNRPQRSSARRACHGPGAVGVDPDPPAGAECVAHRLDPRDVGRRRLAGLGDLDLGGGAAGPGDDRVRRLGADRRHGRVDGHCAATGAGQPRPPPARRPASGRTRAARTRRTARTRPTRPGPRSARPPGP